MTTGADAWTPEALLPAAEQVIARCRVLAAITDVPGETTRTYLSDGMRRANAQVAAWMREAGMQVHVDAAGNLHGCPAGAERAVSPFVLASHLDTVPDAGAFDGVLGVVLAIALSERCAASLPFPLRVIAFSEEEGVRFGVPFLGSRALMGELDEATLRKQDKAGKTVRDAIEAYGLKAEDLPTAALRGARGYLELHIEQGPVLDADGLPLAVVESIAGQSHFYLRFVGSTNHAGTTPMNLRRDALVVAASWVMRVEAMARETPGVVATVGSLTVMPNVRNVVPGEVRCTLDVRSADDTTRTEVAQRLVGLARELGYARSVTVAAGEHMTQRAVPLHPVLTELLADAAETLGPPVPRMTSGAGHDAMVVAPHVPAAMLFLRTPDGLSHHPGESVAPIDVAYALEAGARFLQLLAEKETR